MTKFKTYDVEISYCISTLQIEATSKADAELQVFEMMSPEERDSYNKITIRRAE
jgi:hypothetical protein